MKPLVNIWQNNEATYVYLISMSLVCHKKSYLVCVELTNFRIFPQPIPIFLFKVQSWDSQQRAETAAISNFKISANLTIPN